jgi:thiol-disulfide isomerase/thioredoxin
MNSRLRSIFLLLALVSTATAKPVPDLKFTDLAGHPQRLSSLRGSITVVSFWATWCAPCLDELPRLVQLNQQYRDRGVRFIAISADEPKNRSKIEPFLHQHNIALDTWLGADLDTLDHLNLGNALPATLILDASGEVIGRIQGEARDEDITSRLNWLLNNRQDPAPDPITKRY